MAANGRNRHRMVMLMRSAHLATNRKTRDDKRAMPVSDVIDEIKKYASGKGSPADLLMTIRDAPELLAKARDPKAGLTGKDLFPHRDFDHSTVYQEIQILRDTGVFVQCGVRDSKKYYRFPDWMIGNDENAAKTMINAISDIHYKMRGNGDERPFHRGNIKGHPKKERLVAAELVKMTALHQINASQLPAVPEEKVLWHIIDRDLLAPNQADTSFAQKLNNASMSSDASERVYVPLRGESLPHTMRKIKELCPNAFFDVALSSVDKIDDVPHFNNGNQVKMLVFQGQPGDFTQVEGMVSALRAMHLPKERVIPSLLMIYSAISGSPYEGELPGTELLDDPEEFARRFIFVLPPAKPLPVDDIKELNEKLLRFLTAA